MIFTLIFSFITIINGFTNEFNYAAMDNFIDESHPFHLSKCHIKYNPSDSTLQSTLIIFIDDLEEALADYSDETLNVCDEMELNEVDQYMEDYILNKFKITLNNKPVESSFLGKECAKNQKTLWCYVEFKLESPPAKINVYNSVLMETFPDQKNIVDVELSSGKNVEKVLSVYTMKASFQE